MGEREREREPRIGGWASLAASKNREISRCIFSVGKL